MEGWLDSFNQDTLVLMVLMVATIVVMKMAPRWRAGKGVTFVKPRDLQALINGGTEVVVIDVRSPNEFNGRTGHIEGAVNLTMPDLKQRLADNAAELEGLKNQPVFVTCLNENRSPPVAKLLRNSGFTEVNIVAGGMRRWGRERLPVVGSLMR